MLSRSVLLSALPLLMATSAYAQNFPSGQVRIIVPFPPGGATDVLGRVLAAGLQTAWSQTVISEYRPGAAGVIGTRQVIVAPADGHTLLMASTGAILALAGGQGGAFDVTREGEDVRIATSARSFLHNQVRSMVGSLALVGDGKWSADDLASALAARDRSQCGPVAPPEGLYLVSVDY